MHSTSLKGYFGLLRPFDFTRALALLSNALVLAIVLIVVLALLISGGLSVGTMRWYFFSYLAVLLILGIALSPVPVVPYLIAAWCALDLGLALSSAAMTHPDPSTSLLPEDMIAPKSDFRFEYQALLQAVPRRNWNSPSGIRVHHNSLGLRGPEPSAPDLRKPMIFAFGGSTTYDLAVDEGSTWVEVLQRELAGRYAFFNFGVPGYSSSEHLAQTAFYEHVHGKRPVCALYYMGWNDIHNAYVPNLDAAYANFQLRFQTTNLQVRKRQLPGSTYSPALRVISIALARRFDSLGPPADPNVRMAVNGPDTRFEAIFVEHVQTIAALNAARGIRTVFIGQVLNREKLGSAELRDRRYGWAPFLQYKQVWDYQQHVNSLLEQAALASGAYYIDAGIDHFHDADFIDDGHFVARGSSKFARLIAPDVARYCAQPSSSK